MPELLLLRHAKSSWEDTDLDDHDRDLAPRGIEAAGRIGRYLKRERLIPDLVLCSTAIRAKRTWQLVAAALDRPVAVRFLRSLYLAPPERILAVLASEAGHAQRVAVVAHNPGLEEALAALDQAGGRPAAREERFPTGALARFAFEVPWPQVAFGTGRLLDFVTPRRLS